jgi:type II secretion system protein C
MLDRFKRIPLALLIASICSSTLGQSVSDAPDGITKRIIGEDLGLVIMGSIVSKDANRNVVLIKERKTGRVNAYKVGHQVTDLPIKAIERDFIVLQFKGDLVAVYQDKFAGTLKDVAFASSSPQPLAAENSSFQEDGFERHDLGGDKEIDVKMTESYRDRLIKDQLSTILMQATATPLVEDGLIVGFELSQIDEGSIYDKGGFMNLDVVTAVNGIPLDSVAGAVKLLNSLRQADAVEVDIRRNGVKRRMTISVK